MTRSSRRPAHAKRRPKNAVNVHLIDGTYELFRHFYAVPTALDARGMDVGAVRGVLGSVKAMLDDGVTHLGVATDHVIESFRNDLWAGYKTGQGIDPALWAQFPLLESALEAFGVRVWAMVEVEADDALGAAAVRAAADPRVERVIICTPDKDLAQCVQGTRVVQLDRLRRTLRDEAGVVAKFGVPPASIPDYLALVGDSSDGFPGLPGLGREVGGKGAGPLRAPGADSRRPPGVGRGRCPGRDAGGGAAPRSGAGDAVPRAGDAAHRRAGVRQRRRAGLARSRPRRMRRWPSGWPPPPIRARPSIRCRKLRGCSTVRVVRHAQRGREECP